MENPARRKLYSLVSLSGLLVASIVCWVVFMVVSWVVFQANNTSADSWVLGNMAHPAWSADAMAAVHFISHLGDSSVVYTLLTLTVLWALSQRRHLWPPVLLAIEIAVTSMLDSGLKLYFGRPRPPGVDFMGFMSYSFPSGHAMMALGFYGLLGYFLTMATPVRYRPWVIAATAVIVLLVGISRLILGVHYLSDVIAGYSAAAAVVLIAIAIDRVYRSVKPVRKRSRYPHPSL